MTITHDGDVATTADTAADFSANNSGANISGDDAFVQGTGAVGDKMSASNELLVSNNLAGGASGVYDFSSGGADAGEHIIGWFNVKNAISATGGLQIHVRNSAGHNGSWFVQPPNYTGGFVPRVVNTARAFDTAVTWTVGGNPAQLDDVNTIGGEFDIAGSIMGSFNNAQVDQFSVGFGLRAASNRFTFSTLTGVSSVNDSIAAASHGWANGTPLYYDKEGGSVDIGLTDATIYYARSLTAGTVTIHATRAAAIAGTGAINLTAGGLETHSITPTYAFEDVRVVETTLQEEHHYVYDSRTTGANGVFTLRPISSGTITSDGVPSGGIATLTDTGASFQTELVEPGMLIRITNNSKTTHVWEVVSVTDETNLEARQLYGPLDATQDFDDATPGPADTYEINRLIGDHTVPGDYATSDDVYDLILDTEATGTTTSNTFVKTVASNFDVVANVRQGKVILPFTQNQTVGDAGASITVVRTPDTIAV